MKARSTARFGGWALLLAAGLAGALPAQAATDPRAAQYYENALVRYEKKDLAGAIIQLKNALQIDRNLLPVQVLLGKVLLANGDAIAAEVAFAEALRLGVNRTELVLALAETYIALGKQRQLLTEATFNPAGLPREIQIRVLLLRASASADIGDTRAALATIGEARAIDPRSAASFAAEVPIRIRAGQMDDAEKAADRALALAPESAEVVYQKGAVLHQQGALKDALTHYNKALQLDAGHTEARVSRAGLQIDFGKLGEAGSDLAELATISPFDPRAAYLRALLAERENRPAEVSKALRQVTNLLDPVPPDFIRYRPQLLLLNGLAHMGLNEPAKAKPLLEAVQRMQGTSPVSKLLGQIYLTERDGNKAIPILESYLRVHPADVQAINLLAAAHMAEGRDNKAATLMQDALAARDTPELRTTLGLSLINTRRSGDALVHLEAAFRKDSSLTQAGTALVGLYLRARQPAKAVAVADTLVKRNPKSAGLHNLHGLALTAAGNTAGARAAFEKALRIDDRFEAAQLNLARADISAKAYESAAQRLGVVLKRNDRNTEALYEMAVLSERRGKPAEMLRWLENAADFESGRQWRAGLALVDLHLAQQRPEPALEVAKRVAAKAPGDPEILLALARAYIATGDLAGARGTLGTATKVADFDAPLQVRIANLQLAANNLTGASYSLEKALQGTPGHLPAQVLMSEIDLRQGEAGRAESRARKVIEQKPKLAVGHLLLGDIAASRKQTALALESYRRAHQLEPSTMTLLRVFSTLFSQDNGKPALQIAEQWMKTHPKDIAVARAIADGKARTGDFAGARTAYDSVLKLTPDDAGAMNNLANVLLRLNDPAAIKMAEAALAKAPGNAIILDTLGWVLLQHGQNERALQLLRDARLRDPENPDIRYHLAEALARSNRKTEAREELQAALRTARPFEHRDAAEGLLRKTN